MDLTVLLKQTVRPEREWVSQDKPLAIFYVLSILPYISGSWVLFLTYTHNTGTITLPT
jgi:hypothetical protein